MSTRPSVAAVPAAPAEDAAVAAAEAAAEAPVLAPPQRMRATLSNPWRRARYAALRALPVAALATALTVVLQLSLATLVATEWQRLALGAVAGAALMVLGHVVRAHQDTQRLNEAIAGGFVSRGARRVFGSRDDVSQVIGDLVLGLRRRAQLAEASADQQRRMASASASGIVELVTAMVEAEERVRAQIVADLHDTVAQELLVAIYQADDVAEELAVLAARPGSDPELAALATGEETGVAQVAAGVRRAERQLRQLMKDARPPELTRGDLGSAVCGLLSDLDAGTGLAVTVTWPAEPLTMPLAWATTVYRFAQESLRNVAKHAGVTSAELVFTLAGNQLQVVVADQGAGFSALPQPTASGHHVGLQLMALRAGALGGTLTMASTPAAGTRVTLTLPLPQPPRAAA